MVSGGRGVTPSDSDPVEVYPPGEWHPRPAPSADAVDRALATASEWWPYAAGNRADDALTSYLDLFERYLASYAASTADDDSSDGTDQQRLTGFTGDGGEG